MKYYPKEVVPLLGVEVLNLKRLLEKWPAMKPVQLRNPTGKLCVLQET